LTQEQTTLSPTTKGRLEALGLGFLARFYAAETRRHPNNTEALAELGHVLTRLGRHEEGLEVDRQLVRIAPHDATVHYNLACSLALCGRPDAALDALEEAVAKGYDDAPHMQSDPDLASLRGDARFQELAARLSRGPV